MTNLIYTNELVDTINTKNINENITFKVRFNNNSFVITYLGFTNNVKISAKCSSISGWDSRSLILANVIYNLIADYFVPQEIRLNHFSATFWQYLICITFLSILRRDAILGVPDASGATPSFNQIPFQAGPCNYSVEMTFIRG